MTLTDPGEPRQASVFWPPARPKTQFTSSSWMALRPGDIVLIRTEFHQTAGARVGAPVVPLDTGDEDFVAAPISSRERNSSRRVFIAASSLPRGDARNRTATLYKPGAL